MGTDVSTISRDANEILRGQIFGSQGPTVRGGTRLTPEQTQAILRGEPVGRVIRVGRGGGSSRLTPAQHARQLDLAKSAELQKEQARRELASKLETKQQREITQRSEAIAFQRRQERLPEQITRTELPAHTIDRTTIQREREQKQQESKRVGFGSAIKRDSIAGRFIQKEVTLGSAFGERAGQNVTIEQIAFGIPKGVFIDLPKEVGRVSGGTAGDIFSLGVSKLPEGLQPEFGTAFTGRAGQKIKGEDVSKVVAFGTEVAVQTALIGGTIKGAVKVSDIVRTRGLTEVTKESIIAPEFFAGQKFPAIKRGQTAGSLLEEFKPLLPGEIKRAGFTASPGTFAPITTAGRGSSELPGLFQAPRVSPHFLQITKSERTLFTSKITPTLKPTIVRVTPEEFVLTPGVKASQKSLNINIGKTKGFFETAPKGKSYIPFIKTEKEAIIPFGTKLQQVDERFFIKFEGRRIPIKEFKTVGGEAGVAGSITTAGELSKTLSSSRIGSSGLISPLNLASVLSVSSDKGSVSSSPLKSSSSISSSLGTSVPRSSGRTSRGSISSSSVIRSPSSPRGSGSSSRGVGSGGSSYYGGGSSYYGGGGGSGGGTSFIPFKIKGRGRKKRKATFGVAVRRGGKFKLIGSDLSLQQAITTGKRRVSSTLAATYKLIPQTKGRVTGGIRTPKGFRQKKGLTFIERRGLRLSTGKEVQSIQIAKSRKGGIF